MALNTSSPIVAPCFASTSTRPASNLPPSFCRSTSSSKVRATAAIRLWRGLAGRNPGPNPAALPKARRDRLILALRALDGRLDDATYREIASALFGDAGVSDRGWKSHDLRDRTIRLVRFGLGMMRSGYRRLLLYPYRGR